jgi:ABC-2 type transport system permease protein
MSIRNTVRAIPALMKVGVYEAVAYRAELLVWVLSTTMPLIMMALWTAVAREAPIGRFGQEDFVAYFLATFVVRQLTGAWVAWEMNFEVRQGTLGMRLLRPVHPLWAYAIENLAALPMRMVVAIPVAAIALFTVGAGKLSRDPVIWLVWCLAMMGAWLITFVANLAVGCLSLYMESSVKVMDIWLAVFFVFSGYLIPIELFPFFSNGIKVAADWLPFQYQIGFPVQLITAALDRSQALEMLARQWAWVGLLMLFTSWLWRGGLKRFAAYGG